MADAAAASGANAVVAPRGATTKVTLPDGTVVELVVDCAGDTAADAPDDGFFDESSGHSLRMLAPPGLIRLLDVIPGEDVDVRPGPEGRVTVVVPAEIGLDLAHPVLRTVMASTMAVRIFVAPVRGLW